MSLVLLSEVVVDMEKVCTGCGYVGQPIPQGLGSFVVDVAIWLLFSGMVLLTFFIPLILIPLGWTVYHLLTYFTVNCPKCENYDMVSLDSDKGRAALKKWVKVTSNDESTGKKTH